MNKYKQEWRCIIKKYKEGIGKEDVVHIFDSALLLHIQNNKKMTT